MSKKDFEALADAFYMSRSLSGDVGMSCQWHKVLVAVSDVLARSNPRYDSARFEHRAVYGHNLVKACRATLSGCTGEIRP